LFSFPAKSRCRSMLDGSQLNLESIKPSRKWMLAERPIPNCAGATALGNIGARL
jgi:hypothetical protein